MGNWNSIDALPRRPADEDLPIGYYKELAAAAVASCAREYLEADHFLHETYEESYEILKNRKGKKADYDRGVLERKKVLAEGSLKMCMDFFKSERFDIFMPNTDKRWFIDALKAKAKRTRKAARRM